MLPQGTRPCPPAAPQTILQLPWGSCWPLALSCWQSLVARPPPHRHHHRDQRSHQHQHQHSQSLLSTQGTSAGSMIIRPQRAGKARQGKANTKMISRISSGHGQPCSPAASGKAFWPAWRSVATSATTYLVWLSARRPACSAHIHHDHVHALTNLGTSMFGKAFQG